MLINHKHAVAPAHETNSLSKTWSSDYFLLMRSFLFFDTFIWKYACTWCLVGIGLRPIIALLTFFTILQVTARQEHSEDEDGDKDGETSWWWVGIRHYTRQWQVHILYLLVIFSYFSFTDICFHSCPMTCVDSLHLLFCKGNERTQSAKCNCNTFLL